MQSRYLRTGFILWVVATVALRLGGRYILPPARPLNIIVLFALSFAAVAFLVMRLCRGGRLAAAQRPTAAISLLLPTLMLDPFSSAFFGSVFPNLPAESAGMFGGWMLICCAGGLVGALVEPTHS